MAPAMAVCHVPSVFALRFAHGPGWAFSMSFEADVSLGQTERGVQRRRNLELQDVRDSMRFFSPSYVLEIHHSWRMMYDLGIILGDVRCCGMLRNHMTGTCGGLPFVPTSQSLPGLGTCLGPGPMGEAPNPLVNGVCVCLVFLGIDRRSHRQRSIFRQRLRIAIVMGASFDRLQMFNVDCSIAYII